MEHLTVVCKSCGKPFELFREGDSKLCHNCIRREFLEKVDYDWLPSISPKVWEKPTPRGRR